LIFEQIKLGEAGCQRNKGMERTQEQIEKWKPVAGYEGFYEVSSLGRIRRSKSGYILRLSPIKKGYLTVRLNRFGKAKSFLVHGLVAKAFIGERPAGYQVNHKDLLKSNNAVSNLEYLTGRENVRHFLRSRRALNV
jgi:hypothetical protein